VPVQSSCDLNTTGFHVQVSDCADLSVTHFSVPIPSCGCEEMATTTTTECSSTSNCTTAPTLTVLGDSIDTGSYTITASSGNGGSLIVTDNCTGQVVTQVWGDPHVDDASGSEVGEFTGNNLDITLPDGTRVLMEPTAETNGVAYLANATVVSGSDAVTITGTNGAFSNGVTLSSVFPGGAAQNAAYANGATEVTLATNGDLYVDTASGAQGQQVQANNGTSMNLDGLGGAVSSMAA
jgi:hypothetical protein